VNVKARSPRRRTTSRLGSSQLVTFDLMTRLSTEKRGSKTGHRSRALVVSFGIDWESENSRASRRPPTVRKKAMT
jgi:hypothetical protein